MVYVRISQEIKELIQKAKLNRLLGCEKYWDKQIISYDDLDLLIAVLNKRIEQNNTKAILDKDVAKQQKIVLQKVVEGSQILFIKDHFCNNSLKVDDKLDETKDWDSSNDKNTEKSDKTETFGEIKKRYEKEHPQTKEDIIKHEKNMNQIRARVERKKYNKMVGITDEDDITGQAGKGMRQYHESLAFGTSFITLMFLGFVLGYYIGKYAFALKEIHWLILSMVVGIATMILETVLYIIKVERIEADQRRKLNKTKLNKKD